VYCCRARATAPPPRKQVCASDARSIKLRDRGAGTHRLGALQRDVLDLLRLRHRSNGVHEAHAAEKKRRSPLIRGALCHVPLFFVWSHHPVCRKSGGAASLQEEREGDRGRGRERCLSSSPTTRTCRRSRGRRRRPRPRAGRTAACRPTPTGTASSTPPRVRAPALPPRAPRRARPWRVRACVLLLVG